MPIEAMTQKDCDEAARLITALPFFQQYGMTFEKALALLQGALTSARDEVIISKDGGKLSGLAWFVKEGAFARSGYLRLIAVAEKYQCSGVGRKLIQEFEGRYLRPNGIFILSTSTNAHARSFYEKLGYEKVGEIRDFVKEGLTEVIYYRHPESRS